MSDPSRHVVLLGDSIFANAAYTRGAPDVVTHLRRLLPPGHAATLCAVDGATTAGIAAQLSRIPRDATELVLSVGGNDALQNSHLLSLPVRTTRDTLTTFADRLATFQRSYAAALDRVLDCALPTVVCTIYNGALEPPEATVARVALMMFNDVILQVACERRVDVIELRAVCTEPDDYANPIEPSNRGGRKIAGAVTRAIGALPGPSPCRVWT